MFAHLAMPSYQSYPSGAGAGYREFYWNSAGEAERDPCPGGAATPAGNVQFPESEEKNENPDLSPASSGSGNFSQLAPDSATSPHAASPSPQPIPKSQKGGEKSMGEVKKAKSRTAFSKEQLQTLHQRFQSQKYLSPQQIRELAATLALTYKQVKTWFQNRRMKLKRCQKHGLWAERAQSLMQNGFHPSGYLEMHPKFHQGYPVSTAGNIQAMGTSRQNYGPSQNSYAFVASDDGGVFSKAGGACSVQQTVGFIAQHKVDFYHGFPGTVEYTGTKTGDGYSFHHASAAVTSFPGNSGHHLYHT